MIAPLLIGFAFGWILQRSGLSRYAHIADLFRLRDATVLRFLLTSLGTGVIVIAFVQPYRTSSLPAPPTYALGNFAGGVVFGVGMARSGFCPGTIAAGAGEGRLDNIFPGALGLLSGALVVGLSYERVMPYVAAGAREVTFPSWLGVSAPLLAVLLGELVLLTLVAVRWGARRSGAHPQGPSGSKRARPSRGAPGTH